MHNLVLNRPGPVRLGQIPPDEHADQQGNNGAHASIASSANVIASAVT